MSRLAITVVLLSLHLPTLAVAEDAAYGWRGNGTGLWPDATPPLRWHRLPRGTLADLRAQADRPTDNGPGNALPITKGLVRDWLVLGPVPVADAVRDFDQPQFPNEAADQPSTGQRVGEFAWKPVTILPDDPKKPLGDVDLHWLDFLPVIGPFKKNQIAYAHTYLYSPRGGPAGAVIDHACGLKVWLNGQEVYRRPEFCVVLGVYPAISRHELSHSTAVSPHINLNLRPGWNRLLVKVCSDPRPGGSETRFTMRLLESPGVAYDTANILWMTELPARSNATIIRAGEHLFVLAEPDELLCLDRATGRILWSAFNNPYEALSPADRQANPAFRDRIDPLIGQLRQEKDIIRRTELRAKIQQALKALDPSRFDVKLDDHFEAHFGIVGYTSTTPVSDGQHVWAWFGNGVAACYDMEGQRCWITQLPSDELTYSSSPALSEGTLVVFHHHLYGLDARTGQVRWQQRRVNQNSGALLVARLADTPVVVTQLGGVIRSSDGQMLYRPTGQTSATASWSPPVVLGNRVYVPRFGVSALCILDFAGVTGDDWKPKIVATIELPTEIHHGKDGQWLDRPTAGSPLIHDGLAYVLDVYGVLFVMDLEGRRMLYQQDLGLAGLFHYNSLGVAASLTLAGKHIFALDNQGTVVVLEPGRTYREVARNQIATQLDRRWPLPGQETLSHSPLVADGSRLYLRGERYLYCIGEK